MTAPRRKRRFLLLVLIPAVLIAVGALVPIMVMGSGSAGTTGPTVRIAPASTAGHPFDRVARTQGYSVQVHVTPNKASVPNVVKVRVTKAGRPVTGARAALSAQMLDMAMPPQSLGHLGTDGTRSIPALGMGGHWRLHLDLTLPDHRGPLAVALVDRFDA